MTWWAWLILGAVLFGAELFAIDAQFFLVFLGVSAAMVGLADLAGLAMPEWAQWLMFAALALISMFTFRKSLYERIRGTGEGFNEGVAGDHLVVPNELAAGQRSRVSFRGTNWTVVNDGSASIAGGTRVAIDRSEGLTLHVNADTE